MLDYLACNGQTVLHRAAPWAKLTGAGLTLIAVIISGSPVFVGGVLLLQVSILFWEKLLIRPVLVFSVYPLLFGGLFAVSQAWTAPHMATLVLLKSEAAGLILVTLMATTPYIDIFATLQKVLPGVITDMLFMTYRGIFLLIERLEGLLLAIRLRGASGVRGTVLSFRRMAEAFGALVIASFDLVERIYKILEIRGYEGRIRSGSRRYAPGALAVENILPISVGIAAIIGLVVIK